MNLQDMRFSEIGAHHVWKAGVGRHPMPGKTTIMMQCRFYSGIMDFWDQRTIALKKTLQQNGLAKPLSFA